MGTKATTGAITINPKIPEADDEETGEMSWGSEAESP